MRMESEGGERLRDRILYQDQEGSRAAEPVSGAGGRAFVAR